MHHSWLYCIGIGVIIPIGIMSYLFSIGYILVKLGDWLDREFDIPSELVVIFGLFLSLLMPVIATACHGGPK